MEKHIIKPTEGRAVRFTGELIGSAATDMDRARGGSYWSGETGRETHLHLYRTARGKYVVTRDSITIWQGDHNTTSVYVCDTLEELFAELGFTRLALHLYEDAGIDTSVDVD